LFDNILFDLDGTLFDSRSGIFRCMRQMCADMERGSVSDETLMTVIGPPLKTGIAFILGTDDGETVDRGVDIYRSYYAAGGMYEGFVYDGIVPLLEALNAAGCTLYVATSKAEHFAEKIISHCGLSPYFKKIYGPDLEGNRSDKTELLHFVLDDAHLDPRCTLMIGDRQHDMIGAKANNLTAAGALWGFGSRGELMRAGADIVFENPADCASYILN